MRRGSTFILRRRKSRPIANVRNLAFTPLAIALPELENDGGNCGCSWSGGDNVPETAPGNGILVSNVSREDQQPEIEAIVLQTPPLEKASSELTPFMRQWTAAKRENPDALLFFRMGDFYELFYDDAVTVSRELQLTLTARDRERNQPMCGVPYHAVEGYLARLLRKATASPSATRWKTPSSPRRLFDAR